MLRSAVAAGPALASPVEPLERDTDRRWRWITAEQFVTDLRHLSRMLPYPVRGVAGIPRGGSIAAGLLSSWLNVPLYQLSPRGLELCPSSGRRAAASTYSGPLVIADDDSFSGITMDRLRRKVDTPNITAVAYTWSGSFHPPDLFVRRFPCTWLCEWRYFSSWVTLRSGFDFDGVLCEDCPPEDDDDGPRYRNFLRTVSPRWFPRGCRVPLIATARREAYRDETAAWMRRWGIECDRLVMGQWPNLRERSAEKVIDLKVQAFEALPKLTFFCESDPWQAQRIAERVRRPVACPPARRIFNDTLLTEPWETEKK